MKFILENDQMKNEILKFIKNMNKCWTEGNPEDLKSCFHENMVAITPMQRKLFHAAELWPVSSLIRLSNRIQLKNDALAKS